MYVIRALSLILVLMTLGLLESIRNLPGNHLREIRLNIQSSSMRNENLPAHKLVDNGKWSQESWFCMLNHLASLPNLVVLELLGGLVICPEFFRGIVDYPGTPFPSLVEFELQFAPETADGKWFYERDDDALERSRNDPKYDEFWEEEDENEEDVEGDAWSIYSNEEYNSDEYVSVFEDGPFCRKLISRNRFRSLPSTITFLPFLMDSSKAASRIPTLQKFILKLGEDSTRRGDLNYFPVVSRVFELWYLKAGMHRTPLNTPMPNPYVPRDAAYLNQNRIYWRIDGTKPWDDVQAAWGAIAGPDAKIVFLEEDQWTKHVNNSYVYIYKGEF
ncbi:uncharacterized protein K460DRAFT_40560 [Cucurbitaria berberidis CBS 394.84]|uniref:Uncharacterized protein n=1 Tax=Cucurbitaria berberidis CBS 394.84 TaxID=1168544 RepID=A0A9P4LE72_9PLEO|nr:uncharacterized protein K460DRAFT_40560 [Cucurbitaria berberidis CBS 394.84]KAF1851750.1 hypothetical protein K460DRAFT_40560 [Cucurbitaria berberidis CBS 394.84]